MCGRVLKLTQITKKSDKGALGFTLIELIVVVAIIGIFASFIAAKVSRDSDRIARLEAKRFVALVAEARDESIISGMTLALTVDARNSRYEFFQLADGWSELQDNPMFKPRSVAKEAELDWQVIEARWASRLQERLNEQIEEVNEEISEEQLSEQDKALEKLKKLSRQSIIISPLGEIDPFELRFNGEDQSYIAHLDTDGEPAIRVEQVF
jgi:type II secretion system protein H